MNNRIGVLTLAILITGGSAGNLMAVPLTGDFRQEVCVSSLFIESSLITNFDLPPPVESLHAVVLTNEFEMFTDQVGFRMFLEETHTSVAKQIERFGAIIDSHGIRLPGERGVFIGSEIRHPMLC